MKVFLTGACGFLGSNLAEYLVHKKINVIAYTYYNSENSIGLLKYLNPKVLKKIKIIPGDIRDFKRTRDSMRGCDSVINLAALIGIPYSYHSPQSYIDTNINGTYNILEAAKNLGLNRIILTSTSEVYGTAKYIPIDEKHPLNPQSPYAASKVGSDSLGMSYFYSYDLPITIIRPFNTYGPKQSLRAIIPTILNQYLNNTKFLKLGNINTIRDLTYIDDTCRAFYLALKSFKKILQGQTINLGVGYGIKVKDIIREIEKQNNIKFKILIDKNRLRPENSEVMRLISSNKKAKKILNWEPKFNGDKGLNLGLIKTLDWYKKNRNDYLSSDFTI
jgi:NAD dependent epimerase/dehydratase